MVLFPEFHRAVTSPAVPFYASPQFHPLATRLLRKPLAAPSYAEGAGRCQKRDQQAGPWFCGTLSARRLACVEFELYLLTCQ